MAAPTKLTDTLIKQIEGRAAAIASRPVGDGELSPAAEDWSGPGGPAERQPISDPVGWVARQVKGSPVSRRTVLLWERQAKSAEGREAEGAKLDARERLLVRFGSALDALQGSSAGRVSDHLMTVALQSADKTSSVAACKALLPRIDPLGWGSAPMKIDVQVDRLSTKVEDLPQGLVDKLTPEQVGELAAAEQAGAAAQARIAAIVDGLRRDD